MKKAAFFFALATPFLASGCVQQLSSGDTCSELQAIVAGSSDEPSENERLEYAQEIKKLAAKASDPLKDDLSLLSKQMLKGQDAMNSLSDEEYKEYEDAGEKIGKVCGI